MTRALRRRDVLAALGLTPVVAVGALQPASAREAEPESDVEVEGHPVTADRAAVSVDVGSRRRASAVVVTDGKKTVGRAKITTSGKAVVPVRMPEGGRRAVTVRLTRAGSTVLTRELTLTTEADQLRDSLWRVVNKGTAPLAATDQPREMAEVEGAELDPRAAAALAALLTHAEIERVRFRPSNGFRSYGWQQGLYQSYVRRDGVTKADRFSARPGHSEHQTGLAFDAKAVDGTCDLEDCFGETPEGRFLAKHAADAGFVVRYTEDNEDVTGYQPEPWHLRYVGPWLTAYLEETKTTSLEKAFGMAPASTYDS